MIDHHHDKGNSLHRLPTIRRKQSDIGAHPQHDGAGGERERQQSWTDAADDGAEDYCRKEEQKRRAVADVRQGQRGK